MLTTDPTIHPATNSAQASSNATAAELPSMAAAERALLEAIVIGELAPGQSLVPSTLQHRLDVDPIALGRALERLRAGGLVIEDEAGHLRVRRWARADAEDLFAIRHRLEGLAARLCAARVTPAGLREIVGANALFVETLMDRDVEANVRADMAFHAAIVEQARSVELSRVLLASPATGCSMVALGRSLAQPVDRVMGPHVRTCHDPIIEALQAGDPDAAEQAAHHHVDVASRRAFGEAP